MHITSSKTRKAGALGLRIEKSVFVLYSVICVLIVTRRSIGLKLTSGTDRGSRRLVGLIGENGELQTPKIFPWRSQVQLNKLGHQLGLDTYGIDANEEDSSINIVSDGETHFPVPLNKEQLNDVAPSKKRLDVNRGSAKEPKQGDWSSGRRYCWNRESGRRSQSAFHLDQS